MHSRLGDFTWLMTSKSPTLSDPFYHDYNPLRFVCIIKGKSVFVKAYKQ